jgi:hypothetical protein
MAASVVILQTAIYVGGVFTLRLPVAWFLKCRLQVVLIQLPLALKGLAVFRFMFNITLV